MKIGLLMTMILSIFLLTISMVGNEYFILFFYTFNLYFFLLIIIINLFILKFEESNIKFFLSFLFQSL